MRFERQDASREMVWSRSAIWLLRLLRLERVGGFVVARVPGRVIFRLPRVEVERRSEGEHDGRRLVLVREVLVREVLVREREQRRSCIYQGVDVLGVGLGSPARSQPKSKTKQIDKLYFPPLPPLPAHFYQSTTTSPPPPEPLAN